VVGLDFSLKRLLLILSLFFYRRSGRTGTRRRSKSASHSHRALNASGVLYLVNSNGSYTKNLTTTEQGRRSKPGTLPRTDAGVLRLYRQQESGGRGRPTSGGSGRATGAVSMASARAQQLLLPVDRDCVRPASTSSHAEHARRRKHVMSVKPAGGSVPENIAQHYKDKGLE
jgi:hypothetical protein